MAYSLISVADITELKTRRGTSANNTMATMMGALYPLIEAWSVYTWDNNAVDADDPVNYEVVHPTVGSTLPGRWFKVDLDQVPQVNSDWNSSSGVSQILNKPTLFSGAFTDLTGKPTTLLGYGITDAYPLTGNPSGFLTSFTETDPTVPAYSKSLSAFSVIKSSTDLLYEPIFSKNTAFNKNFGTSSGTVAEGNDSRINNGQTAFGWGNHASVGYVTPTSVNTFTNKSGNISQWTNDTGYITGNQTITLSGDITGSGTTGITTTLTNVGTAGTYGLVTTDSKGRVISGKRTETYSGTTNASGQYTVTFGTAYSVAPNIQANIIGATDTQNIRITSISTTGFTVLVRNRVDALGLLPSWNNVNGANVDILITEK